MRYLELHLMAYSQSYLEKVLFTIPFCEKNSRFCLTIAGLQTVGVKVVFDIVMIENQV